MIKASVLIVESDRASVRQLTDLMSGPDLHVSIAFTRGEAIELSLQNSFDLALIAHGLVDGNGLSLFADVLHQRGRSSGVLLSRHADLRVIMAAIGAGFSHVISYPIDSEQIRRILMELLPDLQEQCNGYDYQSERKVQMNIEGYAPDLKSIASLSMSAIRNSHSTVDLIRIIRSVDYPFAGKERLEYFDRDTLERVVCLIRRWSQHRLNARGQSPANSQSENIQAGLLQPVDVTHQTAQRCHQENRMPAEIPVVPMLVSGQNSP